MKRNVLYLALTGFLVSLSMNVSAQDPYYFEDYKTLEIYKTDAYITIDGIADEAIWNAEEITEQECDVPVWDADPTGYKLSFKGVYDDDDLYLFFKVIDPTYIPYDPEQMSGDTNVDNIELYFGANGLRQMVDDNNITSLDPTSDSQLRLQVGAEGRATGIGYANTLIIDNLISGFEYATVRTEEGYNIEMMLSWDIVVPDAYMDNVAEGKKILFDVEGADCINYTEGRIVAYGWSGDDVFAWKRTAKYGDMVFKGMATTGISPYKTENVNYSFNNGILQLNNVELNTSITAFDLSGRLVSSIIYNGETIDLSSLASGVYAVQVGNEGTIKIMK